MWEYRKIVMNCGCEGSLPWSDDIVGLRTTCTKHGTTYVEKASRIYEAKTSRHIQLGITVGEETESPTRRSGNDGTD